MQSRTLTKCWSILLEDKLEGMVYIHLSFEYISILILFLFFQRLAALTQVLQAVMPETEEEAEMDEFPAALVSPHT